MPLVLRVADPTNNPADPECTVVVSLGVAHMLRRANGALVTRALLGNETVAMAPRWARDVARLFALTRRQRGAIINLIRRASHDALTRDAIIVAVEAGREFVEQLAQAQAIKSPRKKS